MKNLLGDWQRSRSAVSLSLGLIRDVAKLDVTRVRQILDSGLHRCRITAHPDADVRTE
jgi:hypothetical protein